MRILLHICCAPCAIWPVDKMRQDGHELQGFFYNPNIHPYTEFKRRRDTLQDYARSIELPVIFDGRYQLEDFLQAVVHREQNRCLYCYAMRLKAAAAVARRGRFEAFTSTLLVSPWQKHDLIRQLGEEIGRATGVPFYYEDWRPGYKQATAVSRQLNLYRQPYCGCIYSEKERYYRGPEVDKA
ncbi:epoxyqueuosine reductase QueH [Desulfurispora thermophila]|uniref:epoxyqueuosine reductase QueH n=1 Tax=Desulfurispora thermophila TaxID=265470 RepID=UPI0003A88BB9|nr:epoxyqueuosine reductase QueH [Desulfurispora thermophila]